MLPGMDEIGTRYNPANIEWLTLAVAQHAAGRRGNGGLVELFALGPAGIKGKKAELKISIWTSVAPMFGDWKNPTAAWNKKFWVPPPEPRPDIGLLSAPEWVLF